MGLCLVGGCTRSEREVKLVSGLPYRDLAPSAVLIRIGDTTLTKADVEGELDFKLALMKVLRPNLKDLPRDSFSKRQIPEIVGQFISKTLYMNAAKAAGVVPTAQDEEDVRRNVLDSCTSGQGRNFEAFMKKLPAEVRAGLTRQMAEDRLVMAYWRSRASGAFEVTDSDIQEVERHVAKLNEKSREILKQQREKAERIYAQIQAGTNFNELARVNSATYREDEASGGWGDFTLREIPYPEMLGPLSTLKPGEVTRPLELEDAIHIVRLDGREGSGAESSVNLNPEHLRLSRIVLQLPMNYETGTTNQMRANIRKQRLGVFQKDWLKELRARTRVEFPSGTNFWSRAR